MTDSSQIRNGRLDHAARLLRTARCDSIGVVPSTFPRAVRMALSKLLSVATCLLSTLTSQRSPLQHQRILRSSRSSANHRQMEASSALEAKAAAALTCLISFKLFTFHLIRLHFPSTYA